MDFAKLMSAQIEKSKSSTPPGDSSNKKYLKRSEVEAQRQAAYLAEQKKAEEERLAKLEKKRKLEEEEQEREHERQEKKRRLAEQSRKLREEEEAAAERARRKRLGLPELPPKDKQDEKEETPLPDGEQDIPDEELLEKLRALDEPAKLFGETHKQRLKRYKRLTGQSPTVKMYDGPIPTTLEPVPGGQMLVAGTLPKDAEGKHFLARQLGSYFNMVLLEWEIALAARPDDVKTSFQGKQAYNAMVQAKENLRPLFRKLEKDEVEDSVLEAVVEIVKAAQDRRYVDANDGYLRLSIGKAAWPIGVTMESYFTYDDPEITGEAAKVAEPSPVDHDVHFRPGIGADGSDTYMPRAVIYDLKGGFGSMRKINALYEPEDDGGAALWPGSTITHRAPTIQPSPYQQALDAGLQPPPLTTDTVRYWSDYSRVYFHPRSLCQIHEFELRSQLNPFEAWGMGDELFANLDREHDLLDRDLRPFVEESDQLQGLQIMSSVDDAWGGFAARYVERLRDEFGKLPVWVWGLEEEEKKTRDKKLHQLTNHALTLHALVPSASTYIPLASVPRPSSSSASTSLPAYLTHFDPASPWHTSALQALALESATLPSRLRPGNPARAPLAQLDAVFNNGGSRRVVEARVSVAAPGALEERLEAARDAAAKQATAGAAAAAPTTGRGGWAGGEEEHDDADAGGAFDMDFSRLGPEEGLRVGGGGRGGKAKKQHALFGRAEALRGAWEALAELEAQNRRARDRFGGARLVQRYGVASPVFPLLDSFPRVFAFGGGGGGAAAGKEEGVAVRTALETGSGVSGRLRVMGQVVGRMVGVEQREELGSGLLALADEYEEGWDSGLEDSEDDDE
ncbi:tubulin domain-containing protein [Macrophomina phaseolina]|uniref:Tubulin domain-containing protein n=1 Tax=Macrophomina phaseolina TaxID=35725 RepID=A0ABQ8G4U5_9PEZI|nr:tubulin domain-containing protein [Macrophomina phaseolina]